MTGRGCLWILSVMALSGPVLADPPLPAPGHLVQARTWLTFTEYQKAIEEFEQAYRQENKSAYLYWIAQCYERLAALPTKTPSEALESKQRALSIYESFIESAPGTEPGLDMARRRIEPLRQEIKDLTEHMAEKELSFKALSESLAALNYKMDQMITGLRSVQELLLRREQGATPAGFTVPTAKLSR